MTTKTKRLRLSSETIRNLDDDELDGAHGGFVAKTRFCHSPGPTGHWPRTGPQSASIGHWPRTGPLSVSIGRSPRTIAHPTATIYHPRTSPGGSAQY